MSFDVLFLATRRLALEDLGETSDFAYLLGIPPKDVR